MSLWSGTHIIVLLRCVRIARLNSVDSSETVWASLYSLKALVTKIWCNQNAPILKAIDDHSLNINLYSFDFRLKYRNCSSIIFFFLDFRRFIFNSVYYTTFCIYIIKIVALFLIIDCSMIDFACAHNINVINL